MSIFEEKYETLHDNGSRINVTASILFLLGFIVYGRYMLTSGMVPFDDLDAFATIVVLLATFAVFFFFPYFGYALSTYFLVFFSFLKSGVKKENDYQFFIEKGFGFLFALSNLAIYHMLIIKAKNGFSFTPTIFFIIGFVLYYMIFDYFYPKLTLFITSYISESEKENTKSKESHVKTSYQKKPSSKRSVITITDSEMNTFKHTLSKIYGTDFSPVKDSLEDTVKYIYKNQEYVTDVNDQHVFKRIISQDSLNLISNFMSLALEDQKHYRDQVGNELSQIANELHKLKHKIDELKRSNMDKSLLLSKERYN